MVDMNVLRGAGLALALSCGAAHALDLDKVLAEAEAGRCDAMHNAGVLYASGQNGQPDYAQAMKWFERSARRGYYGSMYSLGIMYRFGQGVPIDMVQASAWYALAAEAIPKDADDWLIPRAKVAMFARTADEVGKGLTDAQREAARARLHQLHAEISTNPQTCR